MNKSKFYVTPAGAGIALICFFLPWVKNSCSGVVKYQSGADLGGYVWIVFVAAALILVASLYFMSAGKAGKSKPITIIGAVVGLTTMLIKYIDTTNQNGDIKITGLAPTLQYGAILTALGFLIALIGISNLSDE